MRYFFIFLIIPFVTNCTSFSKKEITKDLSEYNSLCFSENQYHSTNNVLINKITKEGILVQLDKKEEPFELNHNCILENSKVIVKKEELKDSFSFQCNLDSLGDYIFFGKNYFLIKSYNNNSIIELYNKETMKSFIVFSENCNIYQE